MSVSADHSVERRRMHCANSLQLDSFYLRVTARDSVFFSITAKLWIYIFFDTKMSIWGHEGFNFICSMCPKFQIAFLNLTCAQESARLILMIPSCKVSKTYSFNLLNKIASCCLNRHANNIYTTNERGRTQVQWNFVEISVENSN